MKLTNEERIEKLEKEMEVAKLALEKIVGILERAFTFSNFTDRDAKAIKDALGPFFAHILDKR